MSASSFQPKPDIDIVVHLVNGTKAVPDLPDPANNPMKVGQTVRYSSPDGKLTIAFQHKDGSPGSPFLGDDGKEILTIEVSTPPQIFTLRQAGDFLGGCTLTLPNGSTVGWPQSGESGGEHHVGL